MDSIRFESIYLDSVRLVFINMFERLLKDSIGTIQGGITTIVVPESRDVSELIVAFFCKRTTGQR